MGLGKQHEAAHLHDVFAHTAAIAISDNDQKVIDLPLNDLASSG